MDMEHPAYMIIVIQACQQAFVRDMIEEVYLDLESLAVRCVFTERIQLIESLLNGQAFSRNKVIQSDIPFLMKLLTIVGYRL